jgi:hypothetical protein
MWGLLTHVSQVRILYAPPTEMWPCVALAETHWSRAWRHDALRDVRRRFAASKARHRIECVTVASPKHTGSRCHPPVSGQWGRRRNEAHSSNAHRCGQPRLGRGASSYSGRRANSRAHHSRKNMRRKLTTNSSTTPGPESRRGSPSPGHISTINRSTESGRATHDGRLSSQLDQGATRAGAPF